jgi:RHH-type proline utilization regulon transcriptional repressor/proline dehydrogenase/delta 1-pyrroline-5-carboxylate dehydrogenase
MTDRLYPQFATHNAHTIAAILEMAGTGATGFEFQRLHGMGEALHEMVRQGPRHACRIYAPVGRASRPAGLSGAAAAGKRRQPPSSTRSLDASVPAATVAADPFAAPSALGQPHPRRDRPELFRRSGATPGLRPA